MPTPVDCVALARRLQDEMNKLIHDEREPRLYGDEFYAEALRRTLGYRTNDGADGGRPLPYATVADSTGLMTAAQADHLRESHTIADRLNAERAEAKAREAREETRRVLRDSARDLAKWLREWCNERTVPAKLRREGVMLAADWIDPDSPVRP